MEENLGYAFWSWNLNKRMARAVAKDKEIEKLRASLEPFMELDRLTNARTRWDLMIEAELRSSDEKITLLPCFVLICFSFSMKIWVCSLSHQSVAASEDSCVLREPRNSCGRPATSSDRQRPDVARLRSER
ncbi:hypothetical protein QL285_036725 [Trifolium repens]|nr:hypothetical protein QL285_036725 [Trifolium repens]